MERRHHEVNFDLRRSFGSKLKSGFKETFFPDDPFRRFTGKMSVSKRTRNVLEYVFPIVQWLPNYDLKKFRYDLLAGVTVASLAVPQGISYARLAHLPPIIGLYASFIPPLIYTILGSSKSVAVGTVATASILVASIVGQKVSPVDTPQLYLHLVFTSAFFSGIFETALGFFRLGMLVDFLSRSTIIGFMGGTAIIIILQQLKGILGLKHLSTNTDVISVLHSVFTQTHQWTWQSAILGIFFICFLLLTTFLKNKKPKLFWVSAMSPLAVVIFGGLFAYLVNGDDHGIETVGPLKKGLNPLSIGDLIFNTQYLMTTIKAGILTGFIALAEGIAVGRSLAMINNDDIDGNKEMMAFGLMNIVGSFTSCYLTTAPFSKSVVNYNAGCKTAMSNLVMSICMMIVLLFLAPYFRYTPLVALSAIIVVAMIGLIHYEEAIKIFKLDKFDFFICMSAFLGVIFISMDVGILLSVFLGIVRALLYVARPSTYKLGKLHNTSIYRDIEQYPNCSNIAGIIVLQIGSPIFFPNASYLRERITRWVQDEEASFDQNFIQYVILDIGGVTSIDSTGMEMLNDLGKSLKKKNIKLVLSNPKIEVMEKIKKSKLMNTITRQWIFLTVDEAVTTCQFSLGKVDLNAMNGIVSDGTIEVE